MPAPLNDGQRLMIIRRLLEGLSYGEVAAGTGVSKSTVSTIWQEFGQGRMPEFESLKEHANLLREVAVELRQIGASAMEAVLGLNALRAFARLGIEPHQMQQYAELCQRLIQDETEAPRIVAAALELQRLERETSLSYEELISNAADLQERISAWQEEVKELEPRRAEVDKLRKEQDGLRAELATLQDRRDSLRRDVGQSGKQEKDLAERVNDLEARAHAADVRLASGRKVIEELAALGLSPDDLPGFGQRLGGIAQRHGWMPGDLRERLLAALEQIEVGLGLEANVEASRGELGKLQKEIQQCRAERDRLQATISRLRREQPRLEGSLVVLREKAITQIQKAGDEAAASVRQAAGNLQRQQDELLQKTLELGEQVGRIEAEIRIHEWLGPLLSLVQGKEDLQPQKVRSLGVIFLKSLLAWLDKHSAASPAGARWSVESLIRTFEGWNA